jgi:hypothetical protein
MKTKEIRQIDFCGLSLTKDSKLQTMQMSPLLARVHHAEREMPAYFLDLMLTKICRPTFACDDTRRGTFEGHCLSGL